jgi:hypothetical protein
VQKDNPALPGTRLNWFSEKDIPQWPARPLRRTSRILAGKGLCKGVRRGRQRPDEQFKRLFPLVFGADGHGILHNYYRKINAKV